MLFIRFLNDVFKKKYKSHVNKCRNELKDRIAIKTKFN